MRHGAQCSAADSGSLAVEHAGNNPGLAALAGDLAAHGLQRVRPDFPAGAAQLFGSAGAVLDLQGQGGGVV